MTDKWQQIAQFKADQAKNGEQSDRRLAQLIVMHMCFSIWKKEQPVEHGYHSDRYGYTKCNLYTI